jgi:hypothetical protein
MNEQTIDLDGFDHIPNIPNETELSDLEAR